MKNSRDKNSHSEITLKEAWYIFANVKHKKILAYQNRKQNSQSMTYDSNKPNWQNAIENFNNSIQSYKKTKYIMNMMEQQVHRKLSNGALTSYGYPVGGTAQSKRSLIPPEFWDNATIEWNKGTASDDIAQYCRIRVAVVQHVPALAPASKKTSGRPSERETIMEAIEVCDLADPEFKNLGQKSQKKRIREQIQHDSPNFDPYGPGYRDKTLEKYIREHYKQ